MDLIDLGPPKASVNASTSEFHLSSAESNPSPSLMINYLPSKFSSVMLSDSFRARRHKGHTESMGSLMPTFNFDGVSLDGFRPGESRPTSGSVDHDSVDFRDDSSTRLWFSLNNQPKKYRKLTWNKFKWILFIANASVRNTYYLSSDYPPCIS